MVEDNFKTHNANQEHKKESEAVEQNKKQDNHESGKIRAALKKGMPVNQELLALKERISHLENQLRFAISDKENLKRIMQKNIDDTNDYAVTNFARDIVNSCDNLERAVENLNDGDHAYAGVHMTWKEIMNVLQRNGIEKVYPLGLAFDFNLHQTISEAIDDEKEPGTVIQVLQCGYTIKKRLLRPAMVIISKKSSDSKNESE